MAHVRMMVGTAALGALLASTAAAGVFRGGNPEYPVSVDYIPFFITNPDGAETVIDVLSCESRYDPDIEMWVAVDLNGDGENAFIDSYIYLFEAAPGERGGLGALVDFNDDDFENGFEDGSVEGLDSYLRAFLNPGEYVLAISTYNLSEEEARAGVNYTAFGPFTMPESPGFLWANHDHGDYRVVAREVERGGTIFDVEGTIFVIPVPGSAAVLAMFALPILRRRR